MLDRAHPGPAPASSTFSTVTRRHTRSASEREPRVVVVGSACALTCGAPTWCSPRHSFAADRRVTTSFIIVPMPARLFTFTFPINFLTTAKGYYKRDPPRRRSPRTRFATRKQGHGRDRQLLPCPHGLLAGSGTLARRQNIIMYDVIAGTTDLAQGLWITRSGCAYCPASVRLDAGNRMRYQDGAHNADRRSRTRLGPRQAWTMLS